MTGSLLSSLRGASGRPPARRLAGRRPFVPTDDDRATVIMFAGCGYAQDRIPFAIKGGRQEGGTKPTVATQ